MPGPADSDPASTGPVGTGPRRRRRWLRRLAETVITLLAAALLAVLLRTYAYQSFWIPSASMVPTLAVNDRILVQKAFFSWHDVREGEIVVFTRPPQEHCGGEPAAELVKRVIALPGQTIYSSGNSIYINGHRLAEPYLPAGDLLGPPIASRQHPYRVPPGEFYVLGDNRADSCDSRFWGPIQGSSITGKAILIIWHDNHPEFHGPLMVWRAGSYSAPNFFISSNVLLEATGEPVLGEPVEDGRVTGVGLGDEARRRRIVLRNRAVRSRPPPGG